MRARRLLVVAVLLAMAAAACSNSKSQTQTSVTTQPAGNTPVTTASAADLAKNIARPG